MRMWTVQYLWKDKEYSLVGLIHPGNVGDFVYLFETTLKIASIRYFPMMGICCVDLTELL